MKVAKLIVGSRAGGNGPPDTGVVEFDDGKCYDFCHDASDGSLVLVGQYRVDGHPVRKIVAAPRRAALLAARLNE